MTHADGRGLALRSDHRPTWWRPVLLAAAGLSVLGCVVAWAGGGAGVDVARQLALAGLLVAVAMAPGRPPPWRPLHWLAAIFGVATVALALVSLVRA